MEGIFPSRLVTACLVMLTVVIGVPALAASGGHDDHDAHAEPVPTGAELVERCEEYREELAVTRAQLKARNVFGRLDLLRAEHRKREKFVAKHCDGDGHHGPSDHHESSDEAAHG